MARLYRPPIPIRVKCLVVLRQLGEMFPEQVIAEHQFRPRDCRRLSLGRLLREKLVALSELLKCEIAELRLDHDPPLGARQRRGEGKRTVYSPDANDPEHLFYRPHGAQHERSHDVKTRVRGDHGQYSDITLIKRERRRERKANPKRYPHLKKKAEMRERQRQRAKEIRRKIKFEKRRRR